jgi:alkanesulfonate monooxygenase SsuD/methylene tetrahydromethanopterin reductase-like flavin-dependent oxidoreductase (luciferase family)
MKALWMQDEAEYHGEFVNFDPAWMWPKPTQKPHPPVLLGGSTDHTLRRVVAWCDGWIPLARGGFDAVKEILRLRKAADAAKRDFSTLSVAVFGAPADAVTLDAYQAAGVHRTAVRIPDVSRDEVLRFIDKLAPLAH